MNYQSPAPPKKKNEHIREDGTRGPSSYAQKQWRQMRREEESGQHSGEEHAKESHSAKNPPPWRKKKKTPMWYHGVHLVKNEVCGHHAHGGHGLAQRRH